MSKVIDNRYSNAISALTYGFNCLIWDSRGKQLYDCILSIHEGYVNILHIIIAKKVSYLLKLNEIYNITDSEYSIELKLKEFNICTSNIMQITISYCIHNPWIPLSSHAGQSFKNSN